MGGFLGIMRPSSLSRGAGLWGGAPLWVSGIMSDVSGESEAAERKQKGNGLEKEVEAIMVVNALLKVLKIKGYNRDFKIFKVSP